MAKDGIMMIFGKKKDEGKDYEEPEAEAGGEEEGPSLSDMGGMKAAKGILAAIEEGSASALDKALKAHYTACEE